jgi:hypothetical protein
MQSRIGMIALFIILAFASIAVSLMRGSAAHRKEDSARLSAADFDCDEPSHQKLASSSDFSFVRLSSTDCVRKQDVLRTLLDRPTPEVGQQFVLVAADSVDQPFIRRLLSQLGVTRRVCWDSRGRVAKAIGPPRGPELVTVRDGWIHSRSTE